MIEFTAPRVSIESASNFPWLPGKQLLFLLAILHLKCIITVKEECYGSQVYQTVTGDNP
jgi:hypothetical protein